MQLAMKLPGTFGTIPMAARHPQAPVMATAKQHVRMAAPG